LSKRHLRDLFANDPPMALPHDQDAKAPPSTLPDTASDSTEPPIVPTATQVTTAEHECLVSHARNKRRVLEIGVYEGATTRMLIGQTQTFPDGTARYSEYRIGGTSLSSPLAAGMLALAAQRRGAPIGFANPALYAIAHTGAYYDITKTDLAAYPGAVRSDFINGVDASGGYRFTARWFDEDAKLTIHVAPGYDDVTGMGSPNGEAWLSGLSH